MKAQARLDAMVARLLEAAGAHITGILLYGPEARGDHYRGLSPLHLLVLLRDLEPATLRALDAPVRAWLAQGQPWPRLFSEASIRDALDVFPIEILAIARHHRVLYGRSPLERVEVDAEQLRLQCERELREKQMRLREGYVLASTPRALRQLLTASYVSLAPVWRGCLHLLGAEVPAHDAEVTEGLARRLGLDVAAFVELGRVAEGTSLADLAEVYRAFDVELARLVAAVDARRLAAPSRAPAPAPNGARDA